MSKLALKKELATMSREQLTDVILTAYSANKAIKDYFDFFVNPDVDKLYNKFSSAIFKEITRRKYHQSTARISRIKKAIKDFTAYGPGPEKVCELRLTAISMLITQEMTNNYSNTLINGTLSLLNDTIIYADRNLMFKNVMEQIDRLIAPTNDRSKYFRKYLRNNVELPSAL